MSQVPRPVNPLCSIAVSPTCTTDTISYLHVLIEENSTFKELYPDESIIPKQHYLVHYPSQIENLGPLNTIFWFIKFTLAETSLYPWSIEDSPKYEVVAFVIEVATI